jgi:hypothetical protein
MKKERQIGIRVGMPAFFTLELEEVYRHSEGAHRALAFPDFCGLLIGLGLEQYRKGNQPEPVQMKAPEEDPHLFDIDRHGLQDLFRDFDEAMEGHLEEPAFTHPQLRVVKGEYA